MEASTMPNPLPHSIILWKTDQRAVPVGAAQGARRHVRKANEGTMSVNQCITKRP